MFRITEGPSSGSLLQYLAKSTRMVLSCPLTWTLAAYAAITPTTSMSTDTIEPFL